MPSNIQAFFDKVTATLTYVVYDETGGHAVVIDPVLDYDSKSGRTGTSHANKLIEFLRSHSLTLDWILETHAHADHLSAAPYIKKQMGGKIAIGENICAVQTVFKEIFNLNHEFRVDGSQFDHLFSDDETFSFGQLQGKVISVPGHTPADMAYLVGDVVFVGDTLFMPDVGSARCDFPGGCASMLYRSVRKLLMLPEQTHMYMCHDYPPVNREHRWKTTVREQRKNNIHLRDGITEEDFVKMRTARDATLDMPMLIWPAIQVNIRAGKLPPAENNGFSYLKIPVNAL